MEKRPTFKTWYGAFYYASKKYIWGKVIIKKIDNEYHILDKENVKQ